MNRARIGRPGISRIAATGLALLALAACSSTQDVLEPSAITPPSAAASSAPADAPSVAPAAATPTSPAQTAAVTQNARIQFAPIVGTSVEAATTLSQRLSSRARERGIRLVGSNDPATTHLLKGYFTPLVEGKETTVIYVWDVYDPQGNRVHRITGQHKSASAGGTDWAAVPASTMEAIADDTIAQLADWMAGRAG